MASVPKRTVLVLHGYSQNAHIFSKRLGALRKACAKHVEMVFVDAPMELDPHDLFGSGPQTTAAPAESASQSTLDALGAGEASQDDPKLKPRGWWRPDPSRTKMDGIEQSLDLLKGILKERKFDGVLGFSQGAGLAAILAALLERPHLYPPFLIDGESPHPPLKFCIAVSGFLPQGPQINPLFEPSYATPTLHVIGKTDVIVPEERAQALVEVSSNARVQFHDGGHFVPSKSNWRVFLSNYLKYAPDGEIPELAPTSGTQTPTTSGTQTPTTTGTQTPTTTEAENTKL